MRCEVLSVRCDKMNGASLSAVKVVLPLTPHSSLLTPYFTAPHTSHLTPNFQWSFIRGLPRCVSRLARVLAATRMKPCRASWCILYSDW